MAPTKLHVADVDGNLTPPVPRIGSHATLSDGGLIGYISELIVYNYRINNAQVNIVNSYLAAKYDLNIPVTDTHTGQHINMMLPESAGKMQATFMIMPHQPVSSISQLPQISVMASIFFTAIITDQ